MDRCISAGISKGCTIPDSSELAERNEGMSLLYAKNLADSHSRSERKSDCERMADIHLKRTDAYG